MKQSWVVFFSNYSKRKKFRQPILTPNKHKPNSCKSHGPRFYENPIQPHEILREFGLLSSAEILGNLAFYRAKGCNGNAISAVDSPAAAVALVRPPRMCLSQLLCHVLTGRAHGVSGLLIWRSDPAKLDCLAASFFFFFFVRPNWFSIIFFFFFDFHSLFISNCLCRVVVESLFSASGLCCLAPFGPRFMVWFYAPACGEPGL